MLVVVALVIVGGAVSFFALVPPTNTGTTSTSTSTTETGSCQATTAVTDQPLAPTTFGAVTEFALPYPLTSPNAITVAPDGSAWFGENGLPGVGHLYPNGTLTEYKMPFGTNLFQSICGEVGYIWGVALWNGQVWVANENQPLLEALDPGTGAVTNVTLRDETSPYTLTTGPDGGLWFTVISGGPLLGRVAPADDAVQYYQFPQNSSWSSASVAFVNSTLGYVLAIDPLSIYPNGITSIVYSFNPQEPNSTFQQVGPSVRLEEPSSIAVGEGGIWLTEHDGTGMAFYNTTSSSWTILPTSTVPYVPYTLSYFDASNGTTVWFNEHYADKLAEISDNATRLTEYAVSDPPTDNLSDIPNTLTMAIGGGRTWFTQWTGNVVGFVSQSYVPPFSVSASSMELNVSAGGSTEVQLQLTGTDSRNLSVQFSDNESNNGSAVQLEFTASPAALSSLDGSQSISVTVAAASAIAPGDYVAALTVSDGLILRSVYVTIEVTG